MRNRKRKMEKKKNNKNKKRKEGSNGERKGKSKVGDMKGKKEIQKKKKNIIKRLWKRKNNEKEKVKFISAKFSACLLGSPFGISSDIAGLSQCQMLFMSGPHQLFKATSNPQCVAVSSGFGWIQDGSNYAARLALSIGPRGVSARELPHLPLPASASWPAASLRLVTDPTVSERVSGGTEGMECLSLP